MVDIKKMTIKDGQEQKTIYPVTHERAVVCDDGDNIVDKIDAVGLKVGTLESLTTTDKSSAVNAINEVKATSARITPSGDPVHYLYVSGGATWIPYNEIQTTSVYDYSALEDWQLATLNNATALADGGTWWHNDIFVSVEQNRINYNSSIGYYTNKLNYVAIDAQFTTNYRESHSITLATDFISNSFRSIINAKTIKICAPNNYCYFTSLILFLGNSPYTYKVIGILDASSYTTENQSRVFHYCTELKYVKIRNLKVSIILPTAPALSAESIAYMINNAQSNAITITLHADAYTRAMADSAVQTALATKTNVTLASA